MTDLGNLGYRLRALADYHEKKGTGLPPEEMRALAQEIDPVPVLEWQIAEGSKTAHVIDTTKPSSKNPDGSRRRNGPRSLCGRYPQRNNEWPWFSLPVNDPGALGSIRHYGCTMCPDCKETQSGH